MEDEILMVFGIMSSDSGSLKIGNTGEVTELPLSERDAEGLLLTPWAGA